MLGLFDNWLVAASLLLVLLVASGFVMWLVRNSPRRQLLTASLELIIGFAVAGVYGLFAVSGFLVIVYVVRLILWSWSTRM